MVLGTSILQYWVLRPSGRHVNKNITYFDFGLFGDPRLRMWYHEGEDLDLECYDVHRLRNGEAAGARRASRAETHTVGSLMRQ